VYSVVTIDHACNGFDQIFYTECIVFSLDLVVCMIRKKFKEMKLNAKQNIKMCENKMSVFYVRTCLNIL